MMTDEEYYQSAKGGSLANRLVGYARKQIHQRFLDLMRPVQGDAILDFGASEFVEENANYLERHYPFHGDITCAGIGDGSEIREHFPQVAYKRLVPMEPLPFETKQFDIAYSNAVLEHVGGRENRLFLLGELSRVSKRMFVALPNRYFPVEHHTAIPLIHFTPDLFRKALAGGERAYWSHIENLDFIGKRQLLEELSSVRADARVEFAGIRLGPFSSNIIGVSHG